MFVFILNLCFIWLMMMFKCNLFILEMIVLLDFLLVWIWNEGFFCVKWFNVKFIFFWFVLVFGFIVIEIIGFGNFICLRIIGVFNVYNVLFVLIFFKLIVVVMLFVWIFLIFLCLLVCICMIWLKCLCFCFIEL